MRMNVLMIQHTIYIILAIKRYYFFLYYWCRCRCGCCPTYIQFIHCTKEIIFVEETILLVLIGSLFKTDGLSAKHRFLNEGNLNEKRESLTEAKSFFEFWEIFRNRIPWSQTSTYLLIEAKSITFERSRNPY